VESTYIAKPTEADEADEADEASLILKYCNMKDFFISVVREFEGDTY
jgi:hypothetical protein